MATTHNKEEGEPPEVIVTSPGFGPKSRPRKLFKLNSKEGGEANSIRGLNQHITGVPSKGKHVRVQDVLPASASSSIYMGSYKHSPRQSRTSLGGLAKTPEGSVAPTPRVSMSQIHLEHLLQDLNLELETYGVEEYRDGFFDGLFLKPPTSDQEDLMRMAEYTLPAAFKKQHPLSPSHFLPKQWHDIKSATYNVTRTRAGIQLTRSFLAFFIAYVLCIVPVTGDWLGKYREIMVLSTIINHPGRTVGAQIDGTILTILGTASGLGWGAFALYLSDSSSIAANGYGGVLATFLFFFMGTAAALRSYFIRLYQLVIAAGISVIYTCLADISRTVAWSKLLSYGIPWVIGQAICLIVCCTIFPDAGARPIAVALHDAFATMQDGLRFPRTDVVALHRQLALTFVNLSQAYRDLALDISVTRFSPADIASLRNLMQSVVRSLLALKPESNLFEDLEHADHTESEQDQMETDKMTTQSNSAAAIIEIDIHAPEPALEPTPESDHAVRLVAHKMAGPVKELLSWMRIAISSCDAVLLDMSGYRKYLGPPENVSSDIVGALTNIRMAMLKFDEEHDLLMENRQLPATYSDHPELVKYFLFMNPVRQAANSIEDLLVAVMKMQQKNRGWRFYLPSFWSLQRTNAQVRHDRGGVTAGFFFHSQKQLNRLMHDLQKSIYQPLPREKDGVIGSPSLEEYKEEEEVVMDRETANKKSFRYLLWLGLHRLQGFETRFALKVAMATSLLSVPAWLEQSAGWYNRYQAWWAVIMVWFMMHPRYALKKQPFSWFSNQRFCWRVVSGSSLKIFFDRWTPVLSTFLITTSLLMITFFPCPCSPYRQQHDLFPSAYGRIHILWLTNYRVGGNFQDLVTRSLCGVIGAAWGGFSYAAGNGNPYVMAVFAVVYMIPMLYRFSRSTHPRSGLVGRFLMPTTKNYGH